MDWKSSSRLFGIVHQAFQFSLTVVGFSVMLFGVQSTVAIPRAVAQFQYKAPRTQVPSNKPTPANALKYAFKPLYEDDSKLMPRMAGEFEPQKAILLSVSDLMYQHNGVLTQIVEKTSTRVPLVILYNDDKQLGSTIDLLDKLRCDLSHVSLYKLKLDTIWLRDFGPRIAETSRGAMSLDFFYDGQRPLDDKFPIAWGNQTNADINKVTWTLHGGNLISNGRGLALASSRLFEDNFIAFPKPTPGMDVEFERRKIVIDAFKKDCNINQLLVLEPLRPEATKHVDMFATFLAPDQVLVAQVDPRIDPVNAQILDYNARLLAQVKVDGKPMRVERINYPPRSDKYWSPYTNIILAKNLVLMPVYDSDPPAYVRNAINVYRRLLPDHKVETVNMTSMQKLEGALHCMSINVPEFAELPEGVQSFAAAKQSAKRKGVLASQNNSETPAAASVAQGKTIQNTAKRPSNRPANNVNAAAPVAQTAGNNQSNLVSREKLSQTPASSKANDQLAAIATYRRNFVDQSNRFSVSAYAIGVDGGQVVLLKTENKRILRIDIEFLCREDKIWLSQNVSRIRRNGKKVHEFVLSSQVQ